MSSLEPDIQVALTLLSRENLVTALGKIPGRKQLVLDPQLMRPMDRVAGMSVLKSAGVETVVKQERGGIPPVPDNMIRVYLISANLIQAKFVADQISSCLISHPNQHFHVVLVPRNLASVQLLFEEEGLAGHVTFHDYTWEFIPLNFDLLSLEMNNFFRNQYLDQDHSGLVSVARAIWGVEKLYGQIPNLCAHGRYVKKILSLVNVFSLHYGQPKMKQPAIGSLFIFERDTDWLSCLLSPLTYEGLLDEVFGINCGTVEFGQEVTGKEGITKLQLSSMDKMFEKVRNKHFSSIFSVLGLTAKQLAAAQSAAQGMSVDQMKSFVQNDLRNMKNQSKAVALHIGASERIQKLKGRYFETQLPVEHSIVANFNYKENLMYIKERMAQLAPQNIALRLICLLSQCSDGISQSDFTMLKQQFVQAYGFHHLTTWTNLTRLGILKVKGSVETVVGANMTGGRGASAVVSQMAGMVTSQTRGNNFQTMVKKLKLVPDTEVMNPTEQNNPGYVFNGAYTPLSCKVVQEVIKAKSQNSPEIGQLKEGLKMVTGETILDLKSPDAPKVGLVLFIGGYTMAEVAALRWLQTITGWQFVVAGTSNISANSIFNQCEKLSITS